MTPRRYTLWQAAIQKVASSAPGSWLMARTMHHIDRAVLRLSGGRMLLSGRLTGLPVVMLTTTGAKSGQPRMVPLLGIRDANDPTRFALIASNWGQTRHPAWYYNLKANPQATCVVDGKSGRYLARPAEGEEYAAFWQRAYEVYLGFPRYAQRAGRPIPIMILTPVG